MLRLLLLSSVLILAVCSCSKEEEEEVQPEPPKIEPEIEAISPSAGVFRTRVSITGKNFSEIPEGNIVKFGGAQARVVRAEKNLLVAEVPADATTGSVTVSANGAGDIGPSFTYHDLYLLCNYSSGFYSSIKIWKNGEVVKNITSESDYSYATSFVVSGDNFRVAGEYMTGSTIIPAYWNNTQFIPLSENNGRASDICISNEVAHVAGHEQVGFVSRAKYWHDGSSVDLPPGGGSNDMALCVATSNGDLYVGGLESSSDGKVVATYWKNGDKVALGDGTGNSRIVDIAVDGNDVYAVTITELGSAVYSTLWKNGIATDLTNKEYPTEATSVTVSNGTVYVTGSEGNDAGKREARLWDVTNKEVFTFPVGKVNSGALGVALVDGLLIVYGHQFDEKSAIPFYSVNGEIFPVTEVGTNGSVTGMYVK